MARTPDAGAAVEPFRSQVPGAVLEDLAVRLDRTIWPTPAGLVGDHWRDGPDPDFLQSLAGYWRTGFDWRRQEHLINGFPQVTVAVEGARLHAVHVKGRGPDPLPIVLTHGWPSTFTEFVKIIPQLTNPARHGADRGDAFDGVVPSLPGYPLTAGQSGASLACGSSSWPSSAISVSLLTAATSAATSPTGSPWNIPPSWSAST